jgi:surfactin synthase thioesterase subunit
MNNWFSVRLAKNAPALRLFCFPHVGAGTNAFNAWSPSWAPANLGALIGFEMARRIRLRGKAGPVRLLVSAHPAPQIEMRRPPLYDLPRKEFEDELRRFAGTPEELLQNQDLMDIMIQVLRADFEVNETYSY